MTNLASKVRWVSDALSNAVTVLEFSEPGKELTFAFQFSPMMAGSFHSLSQSGSPRWS
jgi:hypothetical protein